MKKWIVEEAPLIKSWLIILAVTIVINLIPAGQKASYSIFQCILTAFSTFFTLVCLRYIHGKKVRSKKPPYLDTEIGVGGYLWRFYLSLFMAFIMFMICFAGVKHLLNGTVTTSNVTLNMVIMIILTPVVIWGLFCKERIAFAKKLIMYLQGM